MTEIIKKLQDPKQAQPFGLRSPEEQEVLKKAGKSNCLVWTSDGAWYDTIAIEFQQQLAYILKPDYEPEPEYVDVPVYEDGGRLRCDAPSAIGMVITGFLSMPDFVKFWQKGDEYMVGRGIEFIAGDMHDKKEIFARFRT